MDVDEVDRTHDSREFCGSEREIIVDTVESIDPTIIVIPGGAVVVCWLLYVQTTCKWTLLE